MWVHVKNYKNKAIIRQKKNQKQIELQKWTAKEEREHLFMNIEIAVDIPITRSLHQGGLHKLATYLKNA